MARASTTPTQAGRVYAELRADILGGRRRPGARLPMADLLQQYRASTGVVREALTRLQGEGLVQSEPQYGFRVKAISESDLQQLTEARCTIEALVLRRSVATGGVQWESAVLAAHHRLTRTVQMTTDDPIRVSDDWAAAHAAFHLALLAACPNQFLLAMAESLRDAAELYRRWSVSSGVDHRDIAAEHQAITEAALAHEADVAADLLGQHIQRTTDILLQAGLGSGDLDHGSDRQLVEADRA